MSVDPIAAAKESKTKISISDVGAQHWEELSWGGTDYKGKDYGWPKFEGPCQPGKLDQCSPPSATSNLVDPYHYYEHKSIEDGGWYVLH
jgi:hypothetical protein